ncbi:MAG TPA: phospho-N-acetylmuramoyl-pentapeptide-transferase [Parachlamydiaceae bacterium]|nr:phospho-N-acetylmuramoyl-pentapeptide-transferase [Parachlamydiaceae bacterium]
MIFFVIDFLRAAFGIKVPMAFEYYSTRIMLAAMTSVIISIFLGPWFIKKLYELKIGQTIRTEDCPLLGQLHEKKKDTPTMGGALILFSMLVSMLLWMNLQNVFTLILFITTITLGALGARDDYLKLKYKNTKGISGKKKLLVQAGLGALVALYLLCPPVTQAVQMGNWFQPPVIKEHFNLKVKPVEKEAEVNSTPAAQGVISLKDYASRIYIPFFKNYVVQFTGVFVVLAILFMICVIAGSSNAVNLTDGLDGLAAGCLIMVASCLGFIAFISNNIDLAGYLNILYIEGSGEIAIYLSAFVGACIGFLWFNGYPAQVFMGDTGSLALGGVIGVSAVLLKREFLLAVIGGIFVAEALSVILQVASYKLRNKKRIFLCAPLHHHFEYKGWPETKVVIRFWIIGLMLAIFGLISLKFQ